MLVVSGEDFMATKKTTKNTKKRGRPASKSNTKRTASSRKNTSKKTKQASPLRRVWQRVKCLAVWTAGSTGVCFSGLSGCDCRFVSGKCEESKIAPQGLV